MFDWAFHVLGVPKAAIICVPCLCSRKNVHGDFPAWQARSWRARSGAFDKFGVSEWAMWVIRRQRQLLSLFLERTLNIQQYDCRQLGCAYALDMQASTLQKSCEIVFALSQSGREDWVHATQFSSPTSNSTLNSVSDGCGTPKAIDFTPHVPGIAKKRRLRFPRNCRSGMQFSASRN